MHILYVICICVSKNKDYFIISVRCVNTVRWSDINVSMHTVTFTFAELKEVASVSSRQ